MAVGEDDVIDLGFDLLPLVFLDAGDVDFRIEMADIADNGLVFHLHHVVMGDDVVVAGGGDEDVGLVGGIVHGDDAVALHRRLQGADRVNFGHPDLCGQRAQCLAGAFAHVAVSAYQRDFAGHHDIGGALDAIHQGLATAIEIVELGLGDRVIDVDGGEFEFATLVHLVEAVDAGGGFFRDALDLAQASGIPGGVGRELGLDRREHHGGFLAIRVVQHGDILLGTRAQMQQQGGIPPVVEDHVAIDFFSTRRRRPLEDLVGVVPVFDQRLALDRVDRDVFGGNGGGGMILGREDVAGSPAHLGAQGRERLDQHRGLDGHVQAAGDARALQGPAGRVFLADGHEAGHLGLGDADFLAAPIGQSRVGNLVVGKRVHSLLQKMNGRGCSRMPFVRAWRAIGSSQRPSGRRFSFRCR